MTGDFRLRMAVEDRFVIVNVWEEHALLPQGKTLENLAETLRSFSQTYDVLLDMRRLVTVDDITEDVIEVAEELGESATWLISSPTGQQVADYLRARIRESVPLLRLKRPPSDLAYRDVDPTLFDFTVDKFPFPPESSMELANFLPPTDPEWELMCSLIPASVPDEFEEEDHYLQRCDEEDRAERQLWETQQYQSLLVNELRGQALAGRRTLETLFHTMGRNSLLIEFSVQATRRDILVTPYHAHALHSVEDHEAILTARPAVIAHKTGALLSTELQELENILGDAATRERDIQMYLEGHPSIFTALGYAHVYPQIVLTREDGTALRPDFFVERADRGWADILDLKVPSMPTVVGGRDRKTLAAAIHELAAQLREYAAYFEDERLSKRIEELYGIRCYKPRLIGIVGHDPRLDDQRQLRRLMTAYSDVSVLTFDQLLQLAKSRLLI